MQGLAMQWRVRCNLMKRTLQTILELISRRFEEHWRLRQLNSRNLAAPSRLQCTRVLCHRGPRPEAASCLYPGGIEPFRQLEAAPDASPLLDGSYIREYRFPIRIPGTTIRGLSCATSRSRSTPRRRFCRFFHPSHTSPTPSSEAYRSGNASVLWLAPRIQAARWQ